mgnify:CR=1 FL=1
MTTLKLNKNQTSKPKTPPQNPFKDLMGQSVSIQTKSPTVIQATVKGYRNGFLELEEVFEFRRKDGDRLHLENEFKTMMLERQAIQFIAQ